MRSKVIVSGVSKCDFNEKASVKTWIFGCCFDRDYRNVSAKEYMYELSDSYRGCFAAVEIRNEILSIRTDGFGLGKIFYYIGDDEVIVSDNVDCIVNNINKMLTVNYAAWAEFLTFHYTLGEKTFFNEINSLRINERVSINLVSGITQHVYDDTFKLIRKSKRSISYSDAVNETAILLTEVMRRALSTVNKPLFPISGGYDSRCILGIANRLLNAERTVFAYTADFDDGNNKDILYGKKVADILNVKHEYLPISSDYYQKTINEYLISTNNCTNMYSALYAFYKHDFPYKGTSIFNGYGGDLLLRGLKQDISLTDEKDYYSACFKKFKMSHKNSTSTKITDENVEKLAFSGLKHELGLCNNDLLIFLFANRNKNNVAYDPYLISAENQCICPFLDKEVIAFVFSLPDDIRLYENYYLDVLKSIDPTLATIPGTNSDDNTWSYKPLLKASLETVTRFLNDSNKSWTHSRGLFSPELLYRKCSSFDYNCENNKAFQTVEIPWMLSTWLDRYDNQLRKDTVVDFISELNIDNKEKYQAVEFIAPSEKNSITKKWINLWKAEKTGKETLDVLMTMDVEAYAEQDIFARHTSKNGEFQKLFRGGDTSFSAIEKIIDSRMKFTFFTDIFNDAISESTLREILLMCDQNGCEVGLHCHHFSLPRDYCESISIRKYYDYPDILQKAVAEGITRLSSILGKRPVSYRAGSFRIEDGHFEALKQNGFLVDSSSFMGNLYQPSVVCNRNTPGWIDCEEVLELPVSSCWDLTAGARRKRFDFNTLQFDKKCELIVKSALSDNSYLMMLSHSWSFLDGSVQSPKIYHEDFSLNAWDEMERIVDLINNLDIAQYYTCHEYYKKIANAPINDYGDSILDINGRGEKPVSYYLPPSFGGLRKIISCEQEARCLVDLSAGHVADSKMCPTKCIKADTHSVQMFLQEVAPSSGDWVMYQVLPRLIGSYHMFVSIACDYYKEKFVGRNSIAYKIILDGNTIYQKYITDKDDDDLKAFDVELCEDSKLSFILECLKDEKPWHWNVASKTVIRGIYLKKI